ncbi:MAG: enoyl-CoA hydratase-related protein, partial [Bacteroidota bacterium]
MAYNNLEVEVRQAIAIVTVARPEKLNALNRETIKELHKVLKKLDGQKKTKAIILTGSGPKAFVAGADILEFSDFGVKEGKKLAAKGQELLFDFIENLGTPVIAAINGFALGGGLELATA